MLRRFIQHEGVQVVLFLAALANALAATAWLWTWAFDKLRGA